MTKHAWRLHTGSQNPAPAPMSSDAVTQGTDSGFRGIAARSVQVPMVFISLLLPHSGSTVTTGMKQKGNSCATLFA